MEPNPDEPIESDGPSNKPNSWKKEEDEMKKP